MPEMEPLSIVALSLVAFLDALFPLSVLVPAEPAFLAVGHYLRTGSGIGLIAAILASAYAGDQVSYLIGRRAGPSFVSYVKRPRARKAIAQVRLLLRRHGVFAVVASRFLGPLAWVTPATCGMLRMPYPRFALASAFGTLLGVGQFILLGYGASAVVASIAPPELIDFFRAHGVALALLVVTVMLCILILRNKRCGIAGRLVKCGAIAASIILATNAVFFSTFASSASAFRTVPLETACSILASPVLARPGTTALHLPQPVNLVYSGDQPVEELMTELGWIRNRTYAEGSIGLLGIAALIWQKKPPVSDLYIDGSVAGLAYQKSEGTMRRLHVRWWRVETPDQSFHYLGAISEVDELALRYYREIPAIIHDIVPETDLAVQAFLTDINALDEAARPDVTMFRNADFIDDVDFETEGFVGAISSGKQQLSSICLQA